MATTNPYQAVINAGIGPSPGNHTVLWDAQGRPYYAMSDGSKQFVDPTIARSDPQVNSTAQGQAWLAANPTPKGGMSGAASWDPTQGKYVTPSNLLEYATLAGAAAPFAAAALGAGVGGAAGAGMPTLSAPAAVLPDATGGILADSGSSALLAGTGAGAGAGSGTWGEVLANPDSVLAGGPNPASLAGIDTGTTGGTGSAVGADTTSSLGNLGTPASLSNAGISPLSPADLSTVGPVDPTTPTPTSSLGNLSTPTDLSNASLPAAASSATSPTNWANILQQGGKLLTSGAQASQNQDNANNNSAANYLKALDSDYTTKMNAAVNVPAGLQRQALWSDYLQTAKNPNPTLSTQALITDPTMQAQVAAQKAAILAKLQTANAVPLPTAPTAPAYQAPGAGTNALSTLGTVAQLGGLASKVPWSSIFSG